MSEYEIGILSFWNVPNYGTFAQEYALQKVISNLFPDKDVRQIAHLDNKHFDFYYNPRRYYLSFPINSKSFWKGVFFSNKNNNSEVNLKKQCFLNAYNEIPHTDIINSCNVNDYHFKKIILGSDIIWDYSQVVFNNDSMLFGNQFQSEQIFSYASSCGMAMNFGSVPEYVVNGINNLDMISVRDMNTFNFIKDLTGIEPLVVLDPVWLWDFSNDINIKKPNLENYILVYGQDFSNDFICDLTKYAKFHNEQIVVLDCNDDNYNWCDVLIKQSKLNPIDWIGYFKYANSIVTSTFHGLTFGMVFKKRIAFYKTDFIMAKARDFLEKTGALKIFVDNNVEKMLNYEWDYNTIYKYIDLKKSESLDFLIKFCS